MPNVALQFESNSRQYRIFGKCDIAMPYIKNKLIKYARTRNMDHALSSAIADVFASGRPESANR